MDSPESSKTVASSSASPSLQESPFFSYLRNLSPIQPPKVAHITQGFSELNIPTPPPVFTSPRLNPQPEILSLKRSQFPRPFKGELSHENENKRGLCTSISDISDLPVIKLMDGLVPCTKKMSEDKGRMPIQTCSPSGCVDEYLADPEDDGATSSGSALKQDNVPETLQSGCTLSKEVTLDQTGKDMETKMTPSEKTEEDLKKSLLPSKLGKQKDGEGQSDITSDKINDVVLFDSSHKPASCSENCQSFELQDLNRQISEGGENSESGHELQVLPETVQILNACDNHSEQSGTISRGPVENREAFQNQRGARRRCLQFDAAEARRKYTSEGHCILKPVDLFPLPRLPETQMEVGLVDSSHMDIETSGSNHIVNSSQPLVSNLSLCPAKTPEGDVSKLNRSVGHSDNTVRKTPLSSGIGLHLNSIVNIAPTDKSEIRSMNSAENGFPNAHKEQSPPLLEQHLHEKSRSSSLPTIGTKMFLTRENSASFRFPPEKLDRVDESNQLSPKKKRKRDLAEPEGCKRCNCRRSKCLKLYCECFAAGIYCAEPCACQECFNKPEYVDTVLETRHQIESRNPLAFAPKVVRRASGSPANIGKSNDRVTPSSARHKRGCNCKKSQCLKKYCECYQGGVGCSDGCRCEGCKNMFGAKEGYGEINEMSFRKDGDDSLEELSDGKLVMGERSNFLQPEHSQPYNLTPATPLFEKSNHGKDVSRSRVPARRCLPSPESDTNILSSYSKSPRSPRNSGQHGSQRNTRGGVDIVFYDQELEFSATGRIEQFSPRWDGLEDLCDLSPLPRVSPRVTTISSSSNADCGTVSRIQLQGSVRLSGSLRWRCSPTTPMPQLGGNKLPTEPSSSGYNILEDETPDILKDNRTPIKAVKVSSPNQKRVSPPHARLKELRSSISPGMRSGRKFVLQSISSFPPLTPCGDPKGSSSTDKRTE